MLQEGIRRALSAQKVDLLTPVFECTANLGRDTFIHMMAPYLKDTTKTNYEKVTGTISVKFNTCEELDFFFVPSLCDKLSDGLVDPVFGESMRNRWHHVVMVSKTACAHNAGLGFANGTADLIKRTIRPPVFLRHSPLCGKFWLEASGINKYTMSVQNLKCIADRSWVDCSV